MVVEQAYGTWQSPISANQLSQRLRLDEVQFGADGETLLWLEGRSGKGFLLGREPGAAPRLLNGDQSVRGGVFYGGGELAVHGDMIIFTGKDGRLYRRTLSPGEPRPITPPHGSVASPAVSPDGRWIAYVWTDEHEDLIAIVDSEGRQWPQKLARGADFYTQPGWHPHGGRLVWAEWDFPNMGWDDTRICIAQVTGSPPRLEKVEVITKGRAGSFLEPRFSPDGRWLSYIAGDGEWDRLILRDLTNGQEHTLVAGDGFQIANPPWTQGLRSYGWTHDSRAIYYLRFEGPLVSLWRVETATGEQRKIELGGYTALKQVSVSPVRDEVALIASSSVIPDRVIRWDGQKVTVEARSDAEDVDAAFLPQPHPITWRAPDGSMVHGVYYSPANPNFMATGLPPAMIHIHGGPTSAALLKFNSEAAYYTSRGWAWLEVNYRGSTGYGRSFQRALYGHWGEMDVEDAVGGAQALADQDLADPNRLVITGGSAGGYTVLNALIHYPGRFKAGICLYGVANLFSMAIDSNKFELRYQDMLIGPLPDAAQKYHDWSPVFHAGKIRDPLLIFQGAEDLAVPPSQAEEIVAALRASGVPHEYTLYAGEGHGFRKSETIADYLARCERFLMQHVLFAL